MLRDQFHEGYVATAMTGMRRLRALPGQSS
ncbi:DUF4060 family protein [Enterobacter hormaechei]|nr:DUF4060 family protein [Enterobacter hormaechei]